MQRLERRKNHAANACTKIRTFGADQPRFVYFGGAFGTAGLSRLSMDGAGRQRSFGRYRAFENPVEPTFQPVYAVRPCLLHAVLSENRPKTEKHVKRGIGLFP